MIVNGRGERARVGGRITHGHTWGEQADAGDVVLEVGHKDLQHILLE